MTDVWDVIIVGSGPAGSAAAIAARHARPGSSVLLLDRSTFPRDKCCGDAVLAAGLRDLAAHGIPAGDLLAGYGPTRQLRLTSPAGTTTTGHLPDEMTILPRRVFDARLLAAARATGATWQRHTVREIRDHGDHVELDRSLRGRVVIGADGAESIVRRAVGGPTRRDLAVALRGYDPHPGDPYPAMVFGGQRRGLSYAWRFPASRGPANVGYGHILGAGEPANRATLLVTMRHLLPGVRPDPATLRAHRLPLSTSRQPAARGRLLLAGDAAALINPLTGEGIYYAITSGLAAGAAAVTFPHQAADRYRVALRRRFGVATLHTATMAALTGYGAVFEAGIRAATTPGVFDDIAALGLAEGHITGRLVRALLIQLVAGERTVTSRNLARTNVQHPRRQPRPEKETTT